MSTPCYVSEYLAEELEAVEAILMEGIHIVEREEVEDKVSGEKELITRVRKGLLKKLSAF